MNFCGSGPCKPAALALTVSAEREPSNIEAVASRIASPPRKQPGHSGLSNQKIVGATTMLLVCCASACAASEYHSLKPRKPCCSQITPLAATVPSACVGKYQVAGAAYPLGPHGMSSTASPVRTPVTPLE